MRKDVTTTLVVIVIVIVAVSAFLVINFSGKETFSGKEQEQKSETTSEKTTQTETRGYEVEEVISPLFTDTRGCEKKDSVVFTSPPIPIDSIIAAEPQGELTDRNAGHIVPGDHAGVTYDASKTNDVFALAHGYIVRVERNRNFGFVGADGVKNYHIYVEYSCTLFGSYVHVTKIEPDILAQDEKLKGVDSPSEEDIGDSSKNIYLRIPIKSGEKIGETKAYGLLGLLLVDTKVTLEGLNADCYKEDEPWKIHAVPVYDYFAEPIKSQILEKNPRTKKPRGGKIDFGIEGKLSGNWFLEGVGWKSTGKTYCGGYLCPYWDGHLAFVYDFVDPEQIRVSIGYDAGLSELGPYGVKGNSPDPASVGVESGIVKYELVGLEDVTKEFGFKTVGLPLFTRNKNEVVGTMLVQMIDDEKIKVEVFPERTAQQVSAFTQDARTYVR